MLDVERLCKRLGDFEMRNVSFSVGRGDYFVMLGESGTGKTVLLETLTGVLAPDSGRVLLNGRDITHEKIQDRRIGLVFQDNTLFPHMTVRRNIAYGPLSRGSGKRGSEERAQELAVRTGVEHLLDRMPGSLSGGEAQRVALARSLANDPDCLLLDEPICSLDSGARAEMRRLLRDLNAGGMTMVHVTHDYEEAVALATRIGVMDGGRIVQIDTPREILLHPRSEFVARFTGIRNLFRGTIRHRTDGTAEFESDGIRLAVHPDVPEGDVVVWFGSEDVVIADAEPADWTHNVLSGRVASIHPARRGTEVVIDAGAEISALITPQSEQELDLAPGRPVFALIEACSVRVLER
jgi:molybdate transport system ATP-binding protein/molybdate/tungstate transport system ATP-binding protein